MYCMSCGNKLEGGQFCPKCGRRIENPLGSQPQNTVYTAKSSPAVPVVQLPDNRPAFIIIGVAVAVLVIAVVMAQGIFRPKYTAPNNGNPYSIPQGLIQPPPDFSYGYSEDSHHGGSGSQTCISCHGSGWCDICNGTGQYSMYGNDLSECSACSGTGGCSICGGDGVY